MVRDSVIEKWLLGIPRNSIAIECQISAGAVSNIADEWSHSVGPDLAKQLRDLAVALRTLKMSPAQCASGVRTVNMIDKMGLDVNSIESFLSDLYAQLKELDLNPKYVARYVEELVSLVCDLNLNQGERTNATSIQKIDTIFEKKRQYNVQLDYGRRVSEARLQEINQQVIQNEKKLQDLLEKNRKLEEEFGWSLQLRNELQKYGLDVSNIRRLVDGARLFSDNKHSINEMVVAYSNYQTLLYTIATIKATVGEMTERLATIQAENKVEEDLLQQRRLKNSELDLLKSMGFGLEEFKTLRSVIVEFASEKGQLAEEGIAVRDFMSDIESHHFDYTRLRKTVDQLKTQHLTSTPLFLHNHS